MKKKSKLSEKAVRIPEIRQEKWSEIISQYLREVESLNNEAARSMRFAMLTQELLGIQPGFVESYLSGIEKYLKVKQKDRLLRGQADNLFGNVIIEFESNIPKHRTLAEEQLCRYTAILWNQEPVEHRTPYICIATDGVRFVTYTPVLGKKKRLKDVDPEDVHLVVLEEADWTKLQPQEVFYWLDRHLLRKEILTPTTERIVQDFGINSHAFQATTEALFSVWQTLKTQGPFSVVYESWEKYLRIVYGSDVAVDELFVRHSYLATLAKLMAWMRISGTTELPEENQIVELLEGRLFKAQGIENFIEEDFFSWLARGDAVKAGVSASRWLFSLLQNYHLRGLSEDVLKSLYQELVDPETRHDLGEFYTPDWLAHRMVNQLLEANPRGSCLDPACGSGTFLYLSIREKRERLGDSLKTLLHILDSVYGADVHPLAAIVSKTNYILALGDLLEKRKGPISIPVYLADTIRLPEREIQLTLWQELPSFKVELNGEVVYLPEVLLDNLAAADHAIELSKEFAQNNKGKAINYDLFRNFMVAQHFELTENGDLLKLIYPIAEVLKKFIDADRDSIWAFVLKNAFKPLFFKQKFDFLIGNPPWIAFHYMDPDYQTFLKRQITKEYELLKSRGELITHMEVATLFLARASDLYLKSGGVVSFVLPRSLFSADHHDRLRRGTFRFIEEERQRVFWRMIWDCEEVEPLFNVPACVVIGQKQENGPMNYPIKGEIIAGKLPRKNASLDEASKVLTAVAVQYWLTSHGKRSYWSTEKETTISLASHYQKLFSQGATIVPRSFWFVEVPASAVGINPSLPQLTTSAYASKEAKAAYKTVALKGIVESRFLYATLVAADVVPFGHRPFRMVVLPIQPKGEHYQTIDAETANQLGYAHLAKWLNDVEAEWKKRRTAKAGRISAVGWLDYRNKLTNQNPRSKYQVLYNTSGTFLTAVVVKNAPTDFKIGRQKLHARGFVADHKTYFCPVNNKKEAFFLAAVLNAPIINQMVKPMQTRGLWGPRDIHKKVLELPIPAFDPYNADHMKLAKLGLQCSRKVERWLKRLDENGLQGVGKLRSKIRKALQNQLSEIDAVVTALLKSKTAGKGK